MALVVTTHSCYGTSGEACDNGTSGDAFVTWHAVQCGAVQCGAVQCGAVQCGVIWSSMVWHVPCLRIHAVGAIGAFLPRAGGAQPSGLGLAGAGCELWAGGARST